MRLLVTAPRSELGRALAQLRGGEDDRGAPVIVNLALQVPNTLLHDGHAWWDDPGAHILASTRRVLSAATRDQAAFLVHASYAFLEGAEGGSPVGKRLRPIVDAAREAERMVLENDMPPAWCDLATCTVRAGATSARTDARSAWDGPTGRVRAAQPAAPPVLRRRRARAAHRRAAPPGGQAHLRQRRHAGVLCRLHGPLRAARRSHAAAAPAPCVAAVRAAGGARAAHGDGGDGRLRPRDAAAAGLATSASPPTATASPRWCGHGRRSADAGPALPALRRVRGGRRLARDGDLRVAAAGAVLRQHHGGVGQRHRAHPRVPLRGLLAGRARRRPAPAPPRPRRSAARGQRRRSACCRSSRSRSCSWPCRVSAR